MPVKGFFGPLGWGHPMEVSDWMYEVNVGIDGNRYGRPLLTYGVGTPAAWVRELSKPVNLGKVGQIDWVFFGTSAGGFKYLAVRHDRSATGRGWKVFLYAFVFDRLGKPISDGAHVSIEEFPPSPGKDLALQQSKNDGDAILLFLHNPNTTNSSEHRFKKSATGAAICAYASELSAQLPNQSVVGYHDGINNYCIYAKPDLSTLPLLCCQPAIAPSALPQQPPSNVPQQVVEIKVRESDTWVDTGIDWLPNQRIEIRAWDTIWAGVWGTGRNDPEGWTLWDAGGKFPLQGRGGGAAATPYCLIGRFGGFLFKVGNFCLLFPRDQHMWTNWGTRPRLFLRTNDDRPGNGNGCFTCEIKVF
jgi:hypothetical protein